ncbi:P-loop containing nucleoside triphosphate hydrolase protein [Fimicolochytrium jonesii]|uniref:P-loop containing nucleoside triphosphate hydrolase protein n=1 Tax=Fimicolochytrium jonesii TaxID=1396493 RepID=UPI0022FE7EC9|nr:P-loop containing nucleoside triphosphate hydrolase protein [Fimicolochytrium jonesii]KAI8824515.1 P-loop containing nucleoside triphosphate hydrolase protein [Fimicolochytrium jonesii]
MDTWGQVESAAPAAGWVLHEPVRQSEDDWRAEFEADQARRQKKHEKTAKEREPEYVIEKRDPKLEKRIFKLSTAGGIAFSELAKVKVTVKGDRIPTPMESYENESLHWLIRENLVLCKYNQPTLVQKHCIPIVTAGRDVMASAQTGSGKTAAFCIPIMNVILQGGPCDVAPEVEDNRLVTVYPLVLILEPTRELAIQIYEECKKFGYRSWIRTRLVYGGVPIDQQVDQLKGRGVDLLIATPGRLQDLIDRKFISLSKVRCLVLDEADRMLDMGFEPAIRKLTETDMPTSKDGRQTLLFSATFPPKIQRLGETFLKDSLRVMIGSVGSVASTINQRFIQTHYSEKDSRLLKLLEEFLPGRILVFVDSKALADRLQTMINTRSKALSDAIHGGRDQWGREAALQKFKDGEINVLVATSVAARGLDISDVTHVINYDIPKDDDEYVHRIGRTGRIGRVGHSVSLFSPGRDDYTIAKLAKKGTIPWDVIEKSLQSAQKSFIKRLMEGPGEELYRPGIGVDRLAALVGVLVVVGVGVGGVRGIVMMEWGLISLGIRLGTILADDG